ncbi:hypothetical protein ZIOFF_025511 [Zingiber officinale]|uniref:Uncharacterized protein n=1 Tax=Zingiber officinale TaxID=94328 RepID=A0A8J5H1K9_ZINOF|nr:hypothetical protein ZIOFF_025511 [Zingiber officinale]
MVSNSHKEATESTPPQRHWGYSSIPDEITLTRSFKAWRNNLKGSKNLKLEDFDTGDVSLMSLIDLHIIQLATY